MSNKQNNITVHVSLGRKLNIGNYESADVNIGIAGLPVDATEEEVEQALTTASLAFQKLRDTLKEKVKQVRLKEREAAG